MEREVGGGIGMGNTCKPMAVSLQSLTKSTTNKKKEKKISIHLDRYTLLHLKWISIQDLLYGTGDSAQCHMAAWMGEEFGGEWIHVYV